MSVILSRGPSIDLEKCVENIGNRYDLVLVAARRTRERMHRYGRDKQTGALISALKDVEAGKVGRDYLKKI